MTPYVIVKNLLADGPKKIGEIAEALGRSRRTAENVLAQLCERKDIRRVELGVYALRPAGPMDVCWYVSGPMTGMPGLNFDLFNQTTAEMRAAGYTVVNPAEINPDPKADWKDCMRADIRALMDCRGIVLLPGWENSRGARLELANAEALQFKVLTIAQFWAEHRKLEAA